MRNVMWTIAVVAAAWVLVVGGPARASMPDEWNSVAVPTAPPLKAVSADPKTTALLVLDILHANCGPAHPRCVATVPKIAALLKAARAKGVFVIYSASPPNQVMTATLPEVAPLPSDAGVVGHADKFIDTDLDTMLKAHGIRTVIVTGSSAHGAVLYTASGAVLRGYDAIVPVDCMSSDVPYSEQSTMFQFSVAPTIAQHTTLTSSTMISF